MNSPRLSPAAASRLVWALFAIGLLLAICMLLRSQAAGDQLNLLARGWLLAVDGKWIAYGNPMSNGGKTPGGAQNHRPTQEPTDSEQMWWTP